MSRTHLPWALWALTALLGCTRISTTGAEGSGENDSTGETAVSSGEDGSEASGDSTDVADESGETGSMKIDLPADDSQAVEEACSMAVDEASCEQLAATGDCWFENANTLEPCSCEWVSDISFENSSNCAGVARVDRCRAVVSGYSGGFGGCGSPIQIGDCDRLQRIVLPTNPDGSFSASMSDSCSTPFPIYFEGQVTDCGELDEPDPRCDCLQPIVADFCN